MPDHEGVPGRGLNAVVYLSYTGYTRKVAEYLAKKSGWPIYEVGSAALPFQFENLLFFAPVHGERLTEEAFRFLENVEARKVAIVLTFGRTWHGNAIEDAARKLSLPLVGAMYLPAPHSYLPQDDYEMPLKEAETILRAFRKDGPLVLPKEKDTFGRWFFPKWRARAGAKVALIGRCTGCMACEKACHFHAIHKGMVDGTRCIRCGACVSSCPEKALTFHLSPFLKAYLKRKRDEKVTIYLAE